MDTKLHYLISHIDMHEAQNIKGKCKKEADAVILFFLKFPVRFLARHMDS